MRPVDWGQAPPDVLARRYEEDGFARVEYIDNSRAVVEWMLRAQGVSPAIVERVLRLNPVIRPGDQVRGLHYRSEHLHMRLMRGCMGKGEFIRRFGRAVFDQINPDHLIKRGRRVYVSHRWRDHACG